MGDISRDSKMSTYDSNKTLTWTGDFILHTAICVVDPIEIYNLKNVNLKYCCGRKNREQVYGH